MEVLSDQETGAVYVKLIDDPIRPIPTHQFLKFGVVFHWDGHGGLVGVEFRGTGETTVIRTVRADVTTETT